MRIKWNLVFAALVLIIFVEYTIYLYLNKQGISCDLEEEEKQFPLAYSIIVHENAEQIYALFRAIYRPYNLYCFHVDPESLASVKVLTNELWLRYENVILPRQSVAIRSTKFSMLDAEILCMRALLKEDEQLQSNYRKEKRVVWKYYIGLTGQDWPLKTNIEIVRILKSVNGSNLIAKLPYPNDQPFIESVTSNIQLWRGSARIIAKWEFVEYALYNSRSIELYNYLKNHNLVLDELFFPTLNNDRQYRAPGGIADISTQRSTKIISKTSYTIWFVENNCYGYYHRERCTLSEEHIPIISNDSNPYLFAGKFVIGKSDNALNFMEQWFYNRSKIVYSDISKNPFIDFEYYQNFILNM